MDKVMLMAIVSGVFALIALIGNIVILVLRLSGYQ